MMLTVATQAIVEGDPPDLPEGRYSDEAAAFVKACLHKVAQLRPTYQALLQSEWLGGLTQTLTKPETITEEDEEAAEEEVSEQAMTEAADRVKVTSGTEDEEIAAWVRDVLQKKETGEYGNLDAKPALHNAPLDAVSPMPSPQTQ